MWLRNIFLCAPPLLFPERTPSDPNLGGTGSSSLSNPSAGRIASLFPRPLNNSNRWVTFPSIGGHVKRTVFSIWIGFLILVVGCAVIWAQATAQISGTAKDQSGAVLPGVEITVTQTETATTRNAVTNETGSYVLQNLPIGPYRLEASLPGFRTYAQTGIVLQVNSNPSINVILEVGQVSEQVEVQANAALVETRNVGVGSVVENTRILELPLNGRQVVELIALAGAATPAPTVNPGGRDPFSRGNVSVAGGLNTGLNYTLDGASHNNPFDNGYLSMPFPDALQEFKVETGATGSAERRKVLRLRQPGDQIRHERVSRKPV